MFKGELKIALVHDELIRRGGAEVVFEELTRIFPQADLFALYAGRPVLELDGEHKPIQTSFLQKFPLWFRRHPSRVLPFLLPAAEQFDFSQYDVVLSSASGFAKAIVTRSNVPHICYCHTPTRYLWEVRKNNILAKLILHYLRMVDYAAAQRVDYWLANSHYTKQRIKKYYGRDSEVIYPPIRTDFFTPGAKTKKYFLVVGRKSPSKNFDQAIFVCKKLSLPLQIVGSGGSGYVSDEELRKHYQSARALLIPGVEDFGMTAVEALACGTPVIAQNAGGVREIVRNFRHGILYDGTGAEALAEGIRRFLEREQSFRPQALVQYTQQFSSAIFHTKIQNTLARIVGDWKDGNREVYSVRP